MVSWTRRMFLPLSPFAPGNLDSRDRFGRLAPRQPAYSPHFCLNLIGWCLLTGIPPACRDGVHILYRQPPSGQSRVDRTTQLRTDGVHCRDSAGTGPVDVKIVRVAGAAFSDITIDQFLWPLFSHTRYVVGMCDTKRLYRNMTAGVSPIF